MPDCTSINASRDAKFYVSATPYDTGDTPTDLTWTEVSEILSTDRTDELAMIEKNARAETMTTGCPGRRTVSIDASMDWIPGGTGFDILRTAYETKAAVAIADMDGDITVTGAKGVSGNYFISSFPVTAGNDDSKQESSVTFMLADGDLFFDYEVAAS